MKITDYYALKAGDRVTILSPQGQELTGRAQGLLCNPAAGTVVLNMGGPHGTPAVCTPENFVRATRKAVTREAAAAAWQTMGARK